ncbi:RNA-directed DNA polymerase, eukaryota, reverse transcriptase zinc-binding domain protein [Tanacetum coccineum]|uniref:RNA-directed DNA polymerase, eukaryota, reverse transcriptase zinc-binding domain protein n=1 Tax=Tanacetum coccineum TaxID=301880 RepID=A0ABQ5DEE5_9ASTR
MNMGMESNPVLVLDESCVNQHVYAYCLLGKVKEFASLTNLKVVLVSKGFDNVKVRYTGSFWVMLEFSSEEVKMKFQSSMGIGTWFSQLQQALSDFIIDGRVTWVELKGIPLKMWSENTFKRKAYWVRAKEVPGWVPDFVEENDEVDESDDESFEGEPNGDNLNNGDNVRGDSEIDEVPDTIFEEKLSNTNDDESSDANSLKYPPGFMPRDDIEDGEVQSIKRNVLVDERDEGTHNIHEEVEASGAKKSDSKKNSKGDGMESVCSSNFKNSETPHSSGSILLLMNELVKCFGGILCVWDSNSLKKLNTTVSDYFVLIRGVWVPNGKQMLIISVYAPQELSKKKMLWHYLSHVIANWKGKVIIMGDFNEVQNKAERFGSVFNVQGANAFNMFISSVGLKEVPLRAELDAIIDKGDGNDDVIQKRTKVVESILKVEKLQSMEAAQKAKIKWAIKGDENSKYYHGILNKKRNQLAIRGVLVEGNWIETPALLIERDVVDAVMLFFHHGFLPKGSNYSFIALIRKTLDANMVNDFRPISLIGSFYKIIAKILANRLVVVLEDIVNEVQSAFVELFQWYKSKKKQSMIFKVDFEKAFDSVQWDYLDDVLKNFGFGEKWDFYGRGKVDQAASKIGCVALKAPFSYLGSKVGGIMSRIRSWNEIVDSMIVRLSKWKMKNLSIGGRLTLLKSVLGSMPIYHMSIFKVPRKVLQRMESIRCHFFNGADLGGKKLMWVKWKNVLASKVKGGIGVSSLYALNKALMFKWVWRFNTQRTSLWTRVIKAIHGDDGKIGKSSKDAYPSIWLDIVHEMEIFKKQQIDVYNFIHKILGNGKDIAFWEEVWHEDEAFKYNFPRLYALETCKGIDVAAKLAHISLDYSFCRDPRGGVEQAQFIDLRTKVADISLVNMRDRWTWALEGSGDFSVASVRKLIDDKRLPDVSSKTRWMKAIPIKVNIHAWKVRLDCLPTRIIISRRGIDIDSILCPICDNALESSRN